MFRRFNSLTVLFAVWSGALAISQSASASTLCVNVKKSGCYSTIASAVSHAVPGDVIVVAHGTYHEDVVISKPLSLIGENAANTIIDATNMSNAIFINGMPPVSGLSGVAVQGFTLTNANYEGLLIADASNVIIQDNRITNNDKLLDPTGPTCPGLPDFETAEDFDCGEAVHLTGVTNSTIANNRIENNAGGILISDETGPTEHNLVTGNVIRNNIYDCGITIPSHPPAPETGARVPFGIRWNTIAGNESSGNGKFLAGAGVGIFGFMPGATVTDNIIIGNRITNNGLPGVAMHGHSGLEKLDNNSIIGNYIADNGADDEDAATPGPTGINIASAGAISGTLISGNVIKDEAYDIVSRTTAEVAAHGNNLNGPAVGVLTLSSGSVDASNNWWGCSQGPGAPGCSTVEIGPGGGSVMFTPWLTTPAVPNGLPGRQQ